MVSILIFRHPRYIHHHHTSEDKDNLYDNGQNSVPINKSKKTEMQAHHRKYNRKKADAKNNETNQRQNWFIHMLYKLWGKYPINNSFLVHIVLSIRGALRTIKGAKAQNLAHG